MNLIKLFVLVFVIITLISCSEEPSGPYFATGIKIGEITQSEAIIWVRLTKNPERVGNDAPMPDIKYIDDETGELLPRRGRPDLKPLVTYPEGYDINNIQGAAPGSVGKARLKYRIKGGEKWKETKWQTVDIDADFVTQFMLTDLSAGEEYEILVEASPLKGKNVSASIEGNFKTAPTKSFTEEINFIVTTCTSYPDVDSETGYKLYPSSLNLDPEFFVHTGDIVY
ncbi:MAG: hypothetical protein R3182_08245, partial [Draconibacterium sp.]|nr:hypothetical protein [Draconibacterium sp.]